MAQKIFNLSFMKGPKGDAHMSAVLTGDDGSGLYWLHVSGDMVFVTNTGVGNHSIAIVGGDNYPQDRAQDAVLTNLQPGEIAIFGPLGSDGWLDEAQQYLTGIVATSDSSDADLQFASIRGMGMKSGQH